MTDGFYYQACYTAAVAAGFNAGDAAAIARAARYTEDCQGYTIPKQGDGGDALLQVVFHYLPGDVPDILAQMRPDFLSEAGAQSAWALRLACRPGGFLLRQVTDHARKGWQELLSKEQKCQRLGIAAHIALDTCLHMGFVGLDDPAVNGAAGILAAAPATPESRRELLERARTEPLAEVFQMEPFSIEPKTGAVGCEAIGPLADTPSAVFTYESPWRREPLVSCVNPIRYASAYLILKAMFQYIRGSRKDWTVEEEDEEAVVDLAVFFAGIPDEATLKIEWPLYFNWLPEPPSYEEPQLPRDETYLRHFELQALEWRSLVTDACPALREYERLLERAGREDAPDQQEPDEPGPDEPEPNELKPDEPGPDEPEPDEPGPDEQEPDEPGPDEPGPEEPGPDGPENAQTPENTGGQKE